MGYLVVALLFIVSFQFATCDSNALGKFVPEANKNSVSHAIIEDFTTRLNVTELKLENALQEIKYLKARDQFITEELSRLRQKIDELLESQSTVTGISGVGTMTIPLSSTAKPPLTTTSVDIMKTIVPESAISDCTLEVMFVLDGSRSIGNENFLRVKEWVKTVGSNIAELQTDVQLGVIQYSHYFPKLRLDRQLTIKTEVKLDHYNYSDFASKVDNIRLMGYTTYTAAALRKVTYDFLNSSNFGKAGNVQVMILITDGAANDYMDLPQSAEELRSIGVVPFAIGVGMYQLNELRIIATGNETSSERVSAFGDFSSLQSAIIDVKQYLSTCEASRPTTSTSRTFSTVTPEVVATASTRTSASPESAPNCTVDVMYVLDGSESVGSSNFSLMKEWVKSSARRLTDRHPLVQLGVMQYSHYFPLHPDDKQPYIRTFVKLAHHDHNDFASAVDGIPLFGYTTYTAAALRLVKTDFFNSENFNQAGNVQIMIVVIDGGDSDKLAESAADLREIGVIPFCIGVNEASVPELHTIATGNLNSSERATAIPYFTDLQTLQLDLTSYLNNC